MHEHILLGLALVCVAGAVAQWIGWKLKLPPIVFLLGAGFVVGPWTGYLDPDKVFGDLLFPVVSLAVSVILFEGGLSLKFKELKRSGRAILNLTTIGVLVSWVLGSLLAHLLLGFPLSLAALAGAILVVTGPTVIAPMLRIIRPKGKVGEIAKWEGILNDPIGAVLAVLVFEIVMLGNVDNAPLFILMGLGKTLLLGLCISALAAALLISLERLNLIPKYLQNLTILALIFGCTAVSNHFQHESALLTVTLFGIILANQKFFDVDHVVEFKENLRVLIISGLFILLAARISFSALHGLGLQSILFLASLVLIVRPLAVWISCLGTSLDLREKLFLMLVAPRGIVVVAVTSIFSLSMEQANIPFAQSFFTEMIFVVLGTVILYGGLASYLTGLIGISNQNPQGVLFVGAHSWARRMAREIHNFGIPVFLIDSNDHSVQTAKNMGLPAASGNVFSEEFLDQIDFSEMGHLVAITANDEVNAFAESALAAYMSDPEIYHLKPGDKARTPFGDFSQKLTPLFAEDTSFVKLEELFAQGALFKTITLRESFDWVKFQENYGRESLPLFCIDRSNNVTVFNSKSPPSPKIDDTLIYILFGPKAKSRLESERMTGNQPQETLPARNEG